MTLTPMHGELLGDEAMEVLFSDRSNLRHMLAFEAALALAEAHHGVIPKSAAEQIASVAGDLVIDPGELRAATARDGVPVPEFVRRLREAVGPDAGPYVHWGATSQDVTDTSLVLRIREALSIVEQRLIALVIQLADMADAHRSTIILGRTRNMQAAPMTFGGKVAAWLSPLLRHVERIHQIRPRIEVLAFAGAVGTLSVLGDKADAVSERVAAELGLAQSDIVWHTQRDRIVEFADFCANVSGSLGKIGADCAHLASSEVGEISIRGAGGSSTMPNKTNPISAEMLITLARFNAGAISGVHQASLQEHERGGPGWALEWLTLPQVVITCGASLLMAERLLSAVDVNAQRMRSNIDRSLGLPYAEAASFMLSEHMPRQKAQALLKDVCNTAVAEQRHLRDVLSEQAPELSAVQDNLFADDWIIASTKTAIDRVLAKARTIGA